MYVRVPNIVVFSFMKVKLIGIFILFFTTKDSFKTGFWSVFTICPK